jgi:hypothetical protein
MFSDCGLHASPHPMIHHVCIWLRSYSELRSYIYIAARVSGNLEGCLCCSESEIQCTAAEMTSLNFKFE